MFSSRNQNNFNSLSRKYKTFVTPGVGDYQLDQADKTLHKSPVCKIGNS